MGNNAYQWPMGQRSVSAVRVNPDFPPASERSNVYGFDQRFRSDGELLFFDCEVNGRRRSEIEPMIRFADVKRLFLLRMAQYV